MNQLQSQRFRIYKFKLKMNPFQRLKQVIDKVNLNYQFQAEEESHPVNGYQLQANTSKPERDYTLNINQKIEEGQEIDKIKSLCETQQTEQFRIINTLTEKIDYQTKALKKSEIQIQGLLQEITQVQKQNQLLKDHLQQQYQALQATSEKERKFKEEIYRINLTVNQLATEIGIERQNKKNLQKEIEQIKSGSSSQQVDYQNKIKVLEEQFQKCKAELEERVEMFEYNVKKNSDLKLEFKEKEEKMREKHQNYCEDLRNKYQEIQKLLFEKVREFEVQSIQKKYLEENNAKTEETLQKLRQQNSGLSSKLIEQQDELKKVERSFELASKDLKKVQEELEYERRNIKMQVIEIKDESMELQLQMYKKQCKELMQEKSIKNYYMKITPNQKERPGYFEDNLHQKTFQAVTSQIHLKSNQIENVFQ